MKITDQEGDSVLKAENIVHEQRLPELYSKTIILVFAVLFSTIFAAALLISNLRNLKKNKAAIWVLLFTIGYLIATAVVMQSLKLDLSLTLIANVIGAAILNEYFWNQYIGKDLEFKKKSWMKPALISVVIVLSFSFLIMDSI